MSCVLREVHDRCQDDCPDCCDIMTDPNPNIAPERPETKLHNWRTVKMDWTLGEIFELMTPFLDAVSQAKRDRQKALNKVNDLQQELLNMRAWRDKHRQRAAAQAGLIKKLEGEIRRLRTVTRATPVIPTRYKGGQKEKEEG
jgi:hypothetical protein